MMTTAPGITTYTTLCTHIKTTLPSLAYPTTIDIPDVPIITDDEEEDLLMDHPTKATIKKKNQEQHLDLYNHNQRKMMNNQYKQHTRNLNTKTHQNTLHTMMKSKNT
jgi:hypothetical protein